MTKDCTCKIYTYGSNDCDLNLTNTKYYVDDNLLGININTSGIVNNEFFVSAPGLFSAYNACCAILLCKLLNVDENNIINGLKNFKVKGRCEVFNLPRGVKVVIDYAHNKISMESIIKTMKEYKSGRVVTVFGCGGGRSSDRRIELGEMSGKYADFSIITMDNPRNDDIDDINKDIARGIESVNGKYIIINDREDAIKYAIENSNVNDIILLLGKGHEKFQQVKDKIFELDEEKIVSKYIK
jgi:UDP-N-acetylmuramoyl-L-alanyl-D-glutamate--2,6-diaminopimelate ligase